MLIDYLIYIWEIVCAINGAISSKMHQAPALGLPTTATRQRVIIAHYWHKNKSVTWIYVTLNFMHVLDVIEYRKEVALTLLIEKDWLGLLSTFRHSIFTRWVIGLAKATGHHFLYSMIMIWLERKVTPSRQQKRAMLPATIINSTARTIKLAVNTPTLYHALYGPFWAHRCYWCRYST